MKFTKSRLYIVCLPDFLGKARSRSFSKTCKVCKFWIKRIISGICWQLQSLESLSIPYNLDFGDCRLELRLKCFD